MWGDLATFNLAAPGEAWPRARAAAEQALALDPDVPDAHVVCGGMAMWYDWDWTAEEAARVVEDGRRQGLTVFWADCIVGMARARQGRRDEARAVLARMIEQHQALKVSCASIAWVAACLGQFDTAFAWFDRGYAERDGLMPSVHVYTDVFVPALARDPRFHTLLERMHLSDVA